MSRILSTVGGGELHGEGGMCGEGDVHGRGHAWLGRGGVHGRRDGQCSGRYASYWNVFFLRVKIFSTCFTNFFRSLVLQPKLDLNEIVAENRDSPVSLDNTEELLKESNKHLPGKI